MTPKEVLRKAAHVVMGRGLTKRKYEDRQGRVCALGAIYKVPGVSTLSIRLTRLVLDAHTIVNFNDYEAKRAHDVASLLMSEAEVVE